MRWPSSWTTRSPAGPCASRSRSWSRSSFTNESIRVSVAEAKVREVLPGFHLLHLPLPMRPTIVNVYLVDGGRGEWGLVDTGMGTEESLAAFRAALDLIGC